MVYRKTPRKIYRKTQRKPKPVPKISLAEFQKSMIHLAGAMGVTTEAFTKAIVAYQKGLKHYLILENMTIKPLTPQQKKEWLK